MAAFRDAASEEAQVIAFRQHAVDMGMKAGEDATVMGVIKNAAAATKEAQGSAAEHAEKQAKNRFDDAMFLSLLSDLEDDLADTRKRIEEYETELIEEYGEDYIVDMAERFLDPEIVERLDGESEGDYRARLESELADLMLNDDGSIIEGYENYTIAKLLNERQTEEHLNSRISTLVQGYDDLVASCKTTHEAGAIMRDRIREEDLRVQGHVADNTNNSILKEQAGNATYSNDQSTSTEAVASLMSFDPNG